MVFKLFICCLVVNIRPLKSLLRLRVKRFIEYYLLPITLTTCEGTAATEVGHFVHQVHVAVWAISFLLLVHLIDPVVLLARVLLERLELAQVILLLCCHFSFTMKQVFFKLF